MVKRLIAAFGLAALSLIPAAALAAPSRAVPDPPPGFIYGTVTQSPCPGPQTQRDDCSLPVSGATVVLYDREGKPVAKTRTAWNGNYSLSAPAGYYVMKVAQEVFLPHCPATRVLVSNFIVFRYDVECESGMRSPLPQDSADMGSSEPYAAGPWWPGDCRFWEVCDSVSSLAVVDESPCGGGDIESYKYWCAHAAA